MLCMETVKLTPHQFYVTRLNISDATFLNARYSGEWEEGVKQGKGKFIYHNGDVFTVSLSNESVIVM